MHRLAHHTRENIQMQLAASLTLAALAATAAAPATAQFAKPEDAIKYRQSAMFVMSQHVGRIGAMVNGRAPYDPKAAVDNAELVATMSHLPWPAYGPGTDKGRETRAKPEIWTDQARFKEAQDRLTGETAKLVAAAKTSNLDNVKAAFQGVGGACKNCHDNFRKD
jgi:cytochrome c556